jgi:hypothetical protein
MLRSVPLLQESLIVCEPCPGHWISVRTLSCHPDVRESQSIKQKSSTDRTMALEIT